MRPDPDDPTTWVNSTVPTHYPGVLGLLVLSALHPTAAGFQLRPGEVGQQLLAPAYGTGIVLQELRDRHQLCHQQIDGSNYYRLSAAGLFWVQFWFHQISKTARAFDEYHTQLGCYLDPCQILLTATVPLVFSSLSQTLQSMKRTVQLTQIMSETEQLTQTPDVQFSCWWNEWLPQSREPAVLKATQLCYWLQWPLAVATVNGFRPCRCSTCQAAQRTFVAPEVCNASYTLQKLLASPPLGKWL